MKEKLMRNMGYLIVALDIGIYFILSYIFVDGFQNNILTILVNGSLLFVGAMIATTSMMKQGLLNGGETQKYKDTLEAHLTQKQKIYPKLNILQAWLDWDYSKLMRIGRSIFINSAGYDYSEVFYENGKLNTNFKIKKPEPLVITKKGQKPFKWLIKFFHWLFGDDWKVYRAKKRFIRKAKHYKVTRLTVSDLMNVDADKDPNNFGMTEKQYSARETGSSAITRLVFSCLLPCISWGFVGFNLETFMTQLMSIILILMTAIFSMFCAFSFKVNTHRNTIIKKINKMEEFDNSEFVPEKESPESKEEDNEGIHAEKSVCSQSAVVEEIRTEPHTGEDNSLCGDT